MRIAICDDEANQIQLTEQYIRQWGKEQEVAVEISAFNSAEAFLFRWAADACFDIAFLDIRMGKMTGIELAEKIRKADDKLIIVFITGLRDYVFRGYDVNALHYLIKPIREVNIRKCLEQANTIVTQRDRHFMVFSVDGQTRRFTYDEVRYFEIYSHYITVRTRTETIRYKKRISSLELELPPDRFVRCHRSCIVNLQYVRMVSKHELVMDDDSRLPVSAERWNSVHNAFMHYNMR